MAMIVPLPSRSTENAPKDCGVDSNCPTNDFTVTSTPTTASSVSPTYTGAIAEVIQPCPAGST